MEVLIALVNPCNLHLCSFSPQVSPIMIVIFKRSFGMLQADYRIVLSQRDRSSWLFLPHTWPLLYSSSIKRCAVEAWFCETRGLISVAWRRGEEAEGFLFFFSFLALHHTSWMCVKTGRYTALWWTECEKWARKNAQSDGRITKQKMFLCWYSKSLTTSTCEPPHQMKKWCIT